MRNWGNLVWKDKMAFHDFKVYSHVSKFWRSRVSTRDSFSRRILKVCNLGRVEAGYWKPKIVFIRSTNTSLVRNCSNIIVYTWILIHVMNFFSQNSTNCKSRFLKFRLEYYSSQVLTPKSAKYSTPINCRIPSYF